MRWLTYDALQTLCFDKFQMTAPLPGCSDDDSRSNTSRHSSTSNLTAADAPARHAEAAYTARDRLEHVRALSTPYYAFRTPKGSSTEPALHGVAEAVRLPCAIPTSWGT